MPSQTPTLREVEDLLISISHCCESSTHEKYCIEFANRYNMTLRMHELLSRQKTLAEKSCEMHARFDEAASSKHRTKTAYEPVRESIFSLSEEFNGGKLFWLHEGDRNSKSEYVKISSEYDLSTYFSSDNIFRKVDRPIEWWEDAVEYLNSSGVVFSDGEGDYLNIRMKDGSNGFGMTRDNWLDFARILLEQEGE